MSGAVVVVVGTVRRVGRAGRTEIVGEGGAHALASLAAGVARLGGMIRVAQEVLVPRI